MAFWGIQVKPKEPHTLRYGDVQGKLVLTQATLGMGSSTKKSILQCEVGDKSPVYLCTLLPEKMESCPLNLEFDEEEDVKFSVVGQTSIHLTGFIVGGSLDSDNEDSYGEDITMTDSEASSDYSDDSEEEYDEDFINDGDADMFPPSSARSSGVVIEEIVDDEKHAVESANAKHPKNSQLVVKGASPVAVLESEDEDGFPISSSREKGSNDEKKTEEKSVEGGKKKNKKKMKETKDDSAQAKGLKRKVDVSAATEEPLNQSSAQPDEGQKKKKKKKDKSAVENNTKADSDVEVPSQSGEETVVGGDVSEEKKKKKKKKGKATDAAVASAFATDGEEKKSKSKPGNVRNFANGLVVEEVEMGKPDGKRASAGKKVGVRYIGKLKNGKIFDSNVGQAPFKFTLGVGQVIKGWDVGVEGMRVGDKRKLTIPPSMAYGAQRVGPIPANSWLEFNVELVEVR